MIVEITAQVGLVYYSKNNQSFPVMNVGMTAQVGLVYSILVHTTKLSSDDCEDDRASRLSIF